MKNIQFYLGIFLLSLIISCSDDETDEEEKEIHPIELNRRTMWVDHIKTTDTIDILSGNDNYKIIEIERGYSTDEKLNEKLDSISIENIFKIYVENNKIIAKRILLEDLFISGTFVLTDAQGVRKTCRVTNPNTQGFSWEWPD